MSDFVQRLELDDLLRHITAKVDRAQRQAACATEECKCLSNALEIATVQIRQLTTWLLPLLSAEQREVLGLLPHRAVAMKAAAETGVFTSQQIEDLKAVGAHFVVQPNDDGPCFNRDHNATTEGR